jgi:integrase
MKGAWWADLWFEGRRIRQKSPVDTKRGAAEFERQGRQRLLEGKPFNPRDERKEVPTFAAFAEEFMSTYAKTNNKPSEWASKRYILDKYLLPAFGKLTLDQIGVREVESLKAKIVEKGRAPATVRNVLARLSKILRYAQRAKLITEVPDLGLPRVPKQRFDFLSFEEAGRLVEAADQEWRAMILTALRAGLRVGELLALRWEDVDLSAGRLVVRRSVWRDIVGTPKSGRDREVPLSGELAAALAAHRRRRLHPGPLVFCADSGRMLGRQEARSPLERACRKAGLRNVGWHVLRHSFASALVVRGVPIKAVQELLGHATIGMTERYAHLSPDVRRDAVQLLDGAPFGHQVGTSPRTEDPGPKGSVDQAVSEPRDSRGVFSGAKGGT